MRDEHEDEITGRELQQLSSHWDLPSYVETARHELRHSFIRCSAIFELDEFESRRDVVDSDDHLCRTIHITRVLGAKRFVPHQNISKRRPERLHIQLTTQSQRQRDVVRRRCRIHLVDQPHTLLSQRQRDALRTVAGLQHLPRSGSGQRRNRSRQTRDSRVLEQDPHGHLRIQRLPQPGSQSGGYQRIAPEGKEIVIEADSFHT
eukprot:gene23244-biopygen19781